MKNELAKGRNFTHYSKLMDAALTVKLKELGPHVKPGLIVEGGFGTGTLLQALTKEHPQSKFIGVDVSKHFAFHAQDKFSKNSNTQIIRGDIRFLPNYSIKKVTTVIFASILHEVHSYNGYDETPVHQALQSAHDVLAPKGRLLIRDGIAPSRAVVALWCNSKDGTAHGNINNLSTEAMFLKFSKEYRHGAGIPFDRARVAGKKCYLLRARDAYEFLTKKDYRLHWNLEINEEYGFWRRRDWEISLERAGFRILQIDEKVNPWIVKNRYQEHVELYEPVKGAPIPFFPTHIVVVAEKK